MAYRTPASPQFVGHMGHPAAAAPNTVASARSAVQAGAHMVEVDVSVTADGQLVAIHGPGLAPTTNGAGRVRSASWDDIRQLAIVRGGEPVTDARVPLLSEIVDALGEAAINFDLKDGRALGPVLDLIVERGLQKRCVISGATVWRVRRVLRRRDDVTVLLNLNRLDKVLARGRLGAWWLATRYRRILGHPQVLALNINHAWVTANLAGRLEALGAELWVFTVDDPDRVAWLRPLGVDSITTNRVGDALHDGW